MSSSEIRPAPGTTAIVHLVRHGEVDNPGRILYGRLPGFHLSEAGRLMAKAAADYLAGRDITVLKSSPLQRAVETAEPIAAEFGLQAEIDDRLIEPWNYFEGMRFGVGDGSLRRPRHWRYLWNPFRPSWGEPRDKVAPLARRGGPVQRAATASQPRRGRRDYPAVSEAPRAISWIARKRPWRAIRPPSPPTDPTAS